MTSLLRSLKSSWNDISISKKLYGVVGIMTTLVAVELLTLRFAMHTLSAVRAFVQGEALWSKAQKNAALSIERYWLTHDEKDYNDFLEFLKVPEGDHRARLAMMKQPPDISGAVQGFIDGKIHPDDTLPMIDLILRFNQISYLNRAIRIWGEGDQLLSELKDTAAQYRQTRKQEALIHIHQLNKDLTVIEEQFSNELGQGSRWMERLVIILLSLAVLIVESVGLSLAIFTTRSLSRGLKEVQQAAQRMGKGEFRYPLTVRSKDEIGTLTESIKKMGELLDESYSSLESRVQERTSKLEALVKENAHLYQEAKRAVQARDDFISIASHELKTPATALFLQLQLLAKILEKIDSSPELLSAQKAAVQSAEQVKRLNALLEELLDLTHLRAGNLKLQPEHCDLSQIAKNLVTELSVGQPKSPITLKTPPILPAWVDPTRIRQVITNLLSNAIKYGEGKPIELELTIPNNNQVRIKVTDLGQGIALDKQSHIFDRFERATTDRSIKGLGLGLFITKQIIQAHLGTIAVTSREGAGSTFTIELPIKAAV